jgi:hypothetical protein
MHRPSATYTWVARGKTSAEVAQMPDLALPWPIVPDDHKDNAHKQGVRIQIPGINS